MVRTNTLCARMLCDDFPLDAADATTGPFQKPHLIIAGFGNMGEAIAIQAAHIGPFATGKLRTPVVDMKAKHTGSVFLKW